MAKITSENDKTDPKKVEKKEPQLVTIKKEPNSGDSKVNFYSALHAEFR